MRDVKEIIKAMLNCASDVENESEVSVDLTYLDKGESSKSIDYTINTYHYLTKSLDFNEFTEEVNNALQSARDFYDDGNEDKIEYPHWTQDSMTVVENLIIDDIEVGEVVNSYNGDTQLDTVLLYTPFVYEDNHYIMLQTHIGGDVRGNYTDAICFQVEDIYGCEMAMLPIEDVYGDVDGEPCSNSYDGCNITSDGDESQGEEMELKFNDDGECISEVSLHLMDY